MNAQDLVRQNAYEVLDQTIGVALNQRSSDFTGVISCTPTDTLASILAYVRERRVHRFVIVEDEDVPAEGGSGGRPARKKGSLVGILSLSDVLRWIVGDGNFLKGHEVKGLGVHGLRGVGGAKASETPEEAEDGRRTASRRGSEGTDGGSSATDGESAVGVGGTAREIAKALESLSLGPGK